MKTAKMPTETPKPPMRAHGRHPDFSIHHTRKKSRPQGGAFKGWDIG